jgi:hypothetical protein
MSSPVWPSPVINWTGWYRERNKGDPLGLEALQTSTLEKE